jgi:hypothetical protein
MRPVRITSTKNFSDTVGNRSRDLPACGAVPHYKNALSRLWGGGGVKYSGVMCGALVGGMRTLKLRDCEVFLPGDALVVGTTVSVVRS